MSGSFPCTLETTNRRDEVDTVSVVENTHRHPWTGAQHSSQQIRGCPPRSRAEAVPIQQRTLQHVYLNKNSMNSSIIVQRADGVKELSFRSFPGKFDVLHCDADLLVGSMTTDCRATLDLLCSSNLHANVHS